MYVYQNKNREICVVLDGVIPAETPDFVIKLDEGARQLVVNDLAIPSMNNEPALPAEASIEAPVVEPEVPADVVEPEVEDED